MSYTAIALCAKALIKIGAKGITSFNEGTAEAQVAQALYATTRDALLTAYPWHFATAQVTLPLLAQTPTADYTCAFQLPTDFLRAISVGSGQRGQGVNYRINKDTLQCNSKNVVLTYIFRPMESNFPAFFAALLIMRLSAEFCLPLTESTSRADFLNRMADSAFAQAKLIDAQQSVPQAIEDFPLIGVRT